MNLLELQRRMAEDVRRPLTPEYEMQETTGDGESTKMIAESYIAPNARLSSFERLEIYNRQYWFRLVSAVAEDFPTLNAVLGQKRFDALILAYLAAHPSTSWTLRNLGGKLPAFLEVHPEFTGRRHRLAVDVAKLEWAYVEAFDGGYRAPLTDDDARAVGPETRLCLQPHLQLLSLSYPVDNLVLAVKKGSPEMEIVSNAVSHRERRARVKPPPMGQERIHLAIHRYDDSVYYRRIERETLELLDALRAGASVAEAAIRAFAGTKLTPERQADRLRESFSLASELGWLCPSSVEEPYSSETIM
ncbi:MAG TPA: DNA-binding domain-containing protein [Edaphobacter sp.]